MQTLNNNRKPISRWLPCNKANGSETRGTEMAGVMKINYGRSLKRIGEFVFLGDVDRKNTKEGWKTRSCRFSRGNRYRKFCHSFIFRYVQSTYVINAVSRRIEFTIITRRFRSCLGTRSTKQVYTVGFESQQYSLSQKFSYSYDAKSTLYHL